MSPLAHALRERGIKSIFVVGLATDYCVRATALDAVRADPAYRDNVFVIREAVRAVGGEQATEAVSEEFAAAGVKLVGLDDDIVRACL